MRKLAQSGKDLKKKEKELIKCVASSETYMFQAFIAASSPTKQLPSCWAIEHLISRELVGSKSNCRLLAVGSVVCMEGVMVVGQLCRHTHWQDVPRGANWHLTGSNVSDAKHEQDVKTELTFTPRNVIPSCQDWSTLARYCIAAAIASFWWVTVITNSSQGDFRLHSCHLPAPHSL